MAVQIRLAHPTDAVFLPAVERSAAEAFRAIPSLAWIVDDTVRSEEDHLKFIGYGTSWVTVSETGRPVGFLCGEVCGCDLHIWELAVQSDHQRSGRGLALIVTAIDWASEHGLAGVTLTTFRDVPWNEPFYKRAGFQTLGDDQVGSRLRDILLGEIERGLPGEQRCAMRYDIPAVG